MENPLFIGREYLTVNGRAVKHPALIKKYGIVNQNKVFKKPMNFIGIDLETDSETGFLKLLGFYDKDDGGYSYYTDNFISNLYLVVKKAMADKKRLVWWNKLDPSVLFKEFLKYIGKPEEIKRSVIHFGKIAGEVDKETGEWITRPVISVKVGDNEFGIMNVIRSSVLFYIRTNERVKTLWAYDVSPLYTKDIKTEAKDNKLDYYSKVDESAHIVDWERFENDADFRENIVLKSNMLDARAVADLATIVIQDFRKVTGWFPSGLISSGQLARNAIVAFLKNKYGEEGSQYVNADLKSIGFYNHIEHIVKELGHQGFKDLYSMAVETYSAGYIEAIRYGYSAKGCIADIASAYPAIIATLKDLREAKYSSGQGTPPIPSKNDYVIIRGLVKIPENVDFNPITIKNPVTNAGNVRASGEYRASYTYNERKFMEEQGATFEEEEWYLIKTKGEPSVLSEVVLKFYENRLELLAKNDRSEKRAKDIINSAYGITFEAVPTYKEETIRKAILEANNEEIYEDIDTVLHEGYRAGEFFNPIYALIITSEVRILLAKASLEIEKRGGKVIVMMTDSVTWKGTPDMLPKELWKEKKTLGYFEKPEEVTDIVCLGAGRYGYTDKKGKKMSKRRGLNIIEKEGSRFDWLNVLKEADGNKTVTKVRGLVSTGTILSNHKYSWKDLGRIVEDKKEMDLIVGLSKRKLKEKLDLKKLKSSLIETSSQAFYPYMYGTDEIDMTLPDLRRMMAGKKLVLRAERRRDTFRASSKKYYDENKEAIKQKRRERYKNNEKITPSKFKIPSRTS